MNSRTIGMILAAAALATGMFAWVRAGDLNPPPGPVQPTMRTNQEIYDRIGAVEQACCNEGWQYWYFEGSAPQGVLVDKCSGVVHGVVFYGSGPHRLFDSDIAPEPPSTSLITKLTDSVNQSTFVQLNARFESGLVFSTPSSSGVTILYRPDALPPSSGDVRHLTPSP